MPAGAGVRTLFAGEPHRVTLRLILVRQRSTETSAGNETEINKVSEIGSRGPRLSRLTQLLSNSTATFQRLQLQRVTA
jgi:hypothetical protein